MQFEPLLLSEYEASTVGYSSRLEGQERPGGMIQEEGKNISGLASICSKLGELSMGGVVG